MAEALSLRIRFRSNPLQTYLHLSWECVLCTVFNFIKTGQYKIANQWSRIHVNSLRRKFKRVQLLTLKLQFSFQLLEIAIPEQLEASFQWKTFPLVRRPNPHFNRRIVLSGWGTLLQIVTSTSYTFLQLMLSPGKEIFAKIHQNVHCWHLQIGESADASNLQL